MEFEPLTTTVVGDYPKIPNRPRQAKHRLAMARFEKGEITFEELQTVENEVTIEVMQEQAEAGVDIITDGQIGWEDAQTYIAAKLDGFEITGLIRYFDSNCYYRRPSAVARVAWKKPITVQDYRFAHDNSDRPVKPVITGPYTLAKLSVHPAYERFEDFVLDLADALNHEMLALQQERPILIQVNEPAITRYKENAEIFAEAMNRLMRGVKNPSALYTYFGDVVGLENMLKKSPFQVIGLDMVGGKANSEIIKSDAWDKKLALGLMDARNTKMENWDKIFEQLAPVFRTITKDRIMINPSCGLEFLPREIAFSKLAHMVNEVKKHRN